MATILDSTALSNHYIIGIEEHVITRMQLAKSRLGTLQEKVI